MGNEANHRLELTCLASLLLLSLASILLSDRIRNNIISMFSLYI